MPRGEVQSAYAAPPDVPATAVCDMRSAVGAVGQAVAGSDGRGAQLVVLVAVLVARLVVVSGGAIVGSANVLPWSCVGPAASTAVRCELATRDLHK